MPADIARRNGGGLTAAIRVHGATGVTLRGGGREAVGIHGATGVAFAGGIRKDGLLDLGDGVLDPGDEAAVLVSRRCLAGVVRGPRRRGEGDQEKEEDGDTKPGASTHEGVSLEAVSGSVPSLRRGAASALLQCHAETVSIST